MDKQVKRTTKYTTILVIAIISVLLNIFFIFSYIKSFNQEKSGDNQNINNNDNIVEDTNGNEQDKVINNEIIEREENEEQEKEYIYKYIEGKEKQVIVEKEVKKTIEVPAVSTDATVTYIDASGNSKSINLPSGTTINFSAGEHGIYDSVPAPITLTDNQELDITDSSYNPSQVEVNYIFKGFSYSGNVFECEYSLANNIVNAECKLIANSITKNNVLYIQHDYIESTGTQYITTNINPNGNERFEIEFTPLEWSTATNNVVCGARKGSNGIMIFGSILDIYGGGSRLANFTYNANINKMALNVKHTVRYEREKMWYDGTQYTATGRQLIDVGYNMVLFASTNDGTIAGQTKMKLHSFVVYDNSGNISDNWVPVQRVSDDVTGLLNLVNGSFLGNSGTGIFDHPDIIYTSGIYAGRIIATGSYEAGSSLTLSVVVNDGYKFVKWSDGNTNATRTITVGNNTVITALFVPNN